MLPHNIEHAGTVWYDGMYQTADEGASSHEDEELIYEKVDGIYITGNILGRQACLKKEMETNGVLRRRKNATKEPSNSSNQISRRRKSKRASLSKLV